MLGSGAALTPEYQDLFVGWWWVPPAEHHRLPFAAFRPGSGYPPAATGGTRRNQAERRAMATQPKTPRPKALKMLLVPLS